MRKVWRNAFFPLLLAVVSLWVLSSTLALSPVPWPDGSAFYLPALDLSQWPPHWRMHAQAAFVPTYDEANFNLMPALPTYLALFARPWVRMGCDATQVIRILSWIPLLLWVGLLWNFLRRKTTLSWEWAALITTAAFLDPISRWASLVVRTEIWVACAALGILFALERRARKGAEYKDWWLPLSLAAGAYFHFEAVFLVPAAAWGLLPPLSTPRWGRVWLIRLLEVGTKTFLLLSPWVAYVFAHWDLFWEQMATQFARLEHGNHLVLDPYLFFHSLFISFGNTSDLPKIFVFGKALFLVFFLGALGLTIARHQKKTIPPTRLEQSAVLMFAAMSYLWCTKGELWFLSLLHWTFWPWFALALEGSERNRWLQSPRMRRVITGALSAFVLLCIVANLGQQLKAPPGTNWQTYLRWTDCLIQTVDRGLPAHPGNRVRVFQPHVPDVLVRISQLRPQWDLTRALDFPALRERAVQFMRKDTNVVLLTRVFDTRDDKNKETPSPSYQGPVREKDRSLMQSELSVPFAPEVLRGGFRLSVCQEGPFWGAVAFHTH